MRAQSPRASSTVTGSPRNTCVTCSDEWSGSARTAATSTLQTRTSPLMGEPRSRRSGGDGDHVAEGRKTRERLALQLPHPLAGQVELVPDRLERPRLALEAEPQLEDPPLALGQRVERLANALPAKRLFRLLEGIRRLAVGEEVAELALVVGADGLVERDRRLCGAERLVDVLDRETRGLGQLLLRRLAAELDFEPARGARELLLPLDDVDRDADRPGVIRDRALDRLADPPRRVGRKLVAAAPVELLDGAVQPERSLLDQVEERDPETAVALRDRDNEAEVRLDHAALRALVAALDRLGEDDLLVRGQQLVPAHVREEELQAVRCAADRGDLQADLRLGRLLLVSCGDGRSHVDPDGLELTRDLLGLVVVEIVLERERLEVRQLDESALLGTLDEGARALGLEQFVKLVLRQVLGSVLSFLRFVAKETPSHSTSDVLARPASDPRV